MAVQLREIECRWCGQVFFVCQRCDFGRRYCGKRCRRRARERGARRARRDYARSPKGRLRNRERQRRHRNRLRSVKDDRGKQETVTDHSSRVGAPVVSCSHDEPPAEPGPTEQPSATSSTQPPVHRILRQPPCTLHGPEATKEAAERSAKTMSRGSRCPVRVARCHFCGVWGVVVESSSTRGRFRRRPHGRHMNPRRRE